MCDFWLCGHCRFHDVLVDTVEHFVDWFDEILVKVVEVECFEF